MTAAAQLVGIDLPAIDAVLAELSRQGVSLADFIVQVLGHARYSTHQFIGDLHSKLSQVLDSLAAHSQLSSDTTRWALEHGKKIYSLEVQATSRVDAGWHFTVNQTQSKQIEDFQLLDMSSRMSLQMPQLWELFGRLLASDPGLLKRRFEDSTVPESDHVDEVYDNEEAEVPNGSNAAERRRFVANIRKFAVASIFLRSTNQKCNWLQSILGLFQHACNTPQKIIELLSNIGLSVAPSSINYAVNTLSHQATAEIRRAGQTRLVSYAFDNFDVELPTTVHGVEHASVNLQHLISGTLIPLSHGVTMEDLRCSRYLWERSPWNDTATLPTKNPDIFEVLGLFPEELDDLDMSRRDRFNAWKFRYDLIHHGPKYFRAFLQELKRPDSIDCIPLTRTTETPAQAMDLNNSTVIGNMDAINNLMHQGGVGDPDEEEDGDDVMGISEYVILFHGDLGTNERVQSALNYRAIEQTPWRRMQHVVFVIALWHLKMAAGDALWRVFIQPGRSREDGDSLMRLVQILWPKETLRIASAYPGFRRMHEILLEAGIAYRLEAWRAEVMRRHPNIKSLGDWAKEKPSWTAVLSISNTLALEYVARGDISKGMPGQDPDERYTNAKLRNQYMLLYEELTWAMNAGDIGRVETCFAPWMCIFRATGKHKYAKQMLQFISDLHFVYPAGLKRAIRYNILCNPTGKLDHFRAIDWVVEWDNFWIKAIYGGKFSNFTVPRIIKQSPLVKLFRDCYAIVEKNFGLPKHYTRHGATDMSPTFRALEKHLTEHNPFIYQPMRKSAYVIPNILDLGLHAMAGTAGLDGDDGEEEEDVEGPTLEFDDVIAEL